MYSRTFWQDHVTEYDNRYREQNNPDGTVSHIPVEGEIIQQGTPQNAANFNNLEEGIVAACEISAEICRIVNAMRQNSGYTNKDLDSLKKRVDELENLISGLDTSGISSLNIAIPISGWAENTDTGGVFIDIPAEDVTENIIPIISIAAGDGAAAAKCGLSDRSETGNGYIRLFAKAAPEREINADVILLSPSKKISSSGESITKLLPATATRLGGVKIGNGVSVTDDGVISVATESISATDEDAENIIDEIFGPQSN